MTPLPVHAAFHVFDTRSSLALQVGMQLVLCITCPHAPGAPVWLALQVTQGR